MPPEQRHVQPHDFPVVPAPVRPPSHLPAPEALAWTRSARPALRADPASVDAPPAAVARRPSAGLDRVCLTAAPPLLHVFRPSATDAPALGEGPPARVAAAAAVLPRPPWLARDSGRVSRETS